MTIVRTPPEIRFWRHVEKSDGCWEWTAYRTRSGYGHFSPEPGASPIRSHRYAYMITVGAIPDGLQIDHLCRNRACVRPDHLEAVTPQENTLRGKTRAAAYAARETCDKGHPFDGSRPARGKRYRLCTTCQREATRRWREKRSA